MAGMQRHDMLDHVSKSDGTPLLLHTIDDVIAKKKEDADWQGENVHHAGGRPRLLTPEEEAQVARLVFKARGQAKVTIPYCKRALPFLRRVSRQVVANTLHEAGLKWLTRRLKYWVPNDHKTMRMGYSGILKRRHQTSLDRFAYTDGTTIFLARGPQELEQKRRGALGRYVWRMSSGKDGLYDENVGASLYAKAQGVPVKIWGFLANGKLMYWVLSAGPDKKHTTTHMNGDRYEHLVSSRFADWRASCFGDDEPCYLVQDHERCLWQARNKGALKAAGCKLEEDFPKSSPDLNAIEGVWRFLRERIDATAPTVIETRPEFLVRLRRCVAWLNEHRREHMLYLCTNQKERAADVQKLGGAKTKW